MWHNLTSPLDDFMTPPAHFAVFEISPTKIAKFVKDLPSAPCKSRPFFMAYSKKMYVKLHTKYFCMWFYTLNNYKVCNTETAPQAEKNRIFDLFKGKSTSISNWKWLLVCHQRQVSYKEMKAWIKIALQNRGWLNQIDRNINKVIDLRRRPKFFWNVRPCTSTVLYSWAPPNVMATSNCIIGILKIPRIWAF